MTNEELKEKARGLPQKPGVYLMLDSHGRVIYVGKAKALKNRVSQYFQDAAGHTGKTRAMVSQIDRFDVIAASSEFEALVLECALIKRHQPRYNILLKDSKGYPYIRLTAGDPYPKFSLAAKVAEDGARYFGPFGGRGSTNAILDALRAALKLPACSRKFPRDIGKERPCLNYHMGRCDGWCRPEMPRKGHDEAISQAIRLLEGRFGEVEEELRCQMERASEALLFEQAALLRDRLRAIELLGKRQKVVAGALADTDVVGFHRGAVKSCFVVLHYLDGELAAKDMELLEPPAEESDEDIVSALVKQYYDGRGTLPRQVLLPCRIDDGTLIARMLSEVAGRRVSLITPQRGAKTDLIRLANLNGAEEVDRATTHEERRNKLLQALGKLLGLEKAPRRIEAFDVSNTGSADIVASMTVFVDARPLKRDYRHFMLKGLDGPDDCAAMAEVLGRRFRRCLEGDEKFSALPDLLLIDGGALHAKTARDAVAGLGLDLPVFGMVKDSRHRTHALVTDTGELIGIQSSPALFALIGQIQEETHRFAIEFHRVRRSRTVRASVLDGIPGIGKSRKAALMKHFKSIQAIRSASPAELERIVPKPAAKAVFDYFQEG